MQIIQILKIHRWLVLIIAFAFIIGLGNPFFDYPLAFSVGDEFESQRVSLQLLATGSLVQSSNYLPLWSWVQVPFIAVTVLFLRLVGHFSSFSQLQQIFILTSPGMFLFIPRILSAMISATSVIWLYGIGRIISGKRLGLLMAGFFAVDVMRVMQAHYGRHTSLFLFFSLGFIYFLIRFIIKGRQKYLYLTCVFITLSAGSYQLGILHGLTLLLVLILSGNVHRAVYNKRFWILGFSCLIFLGILGILTPTALVNMIFAYQPVPGYNPLTTSLSFLQRIKFYSQVLISFEGTVALFGLWGLILLWKREKMISAVLYLTVFITFLPYLPKNSIEPRYLLFPLLLLPLGTAYWCSCFLTKARWQNCLLLCLIGLYPLVLDVRFNYLSWKNSTYLQSKQWIENQIPSDKPLLIYGNNFYLLPELSTWQPAELYETDYYKNLKSYLEKLSISEAEGLKNLKNVRPSNNLMYFQINNQLDQYFQAEDYDYVVIDYYSEAEKARLLKKFNLSASSNHLIKSFSCRKDHGDSEVLLNISNPAKELINRDCFGPYFDVYKIDHNY